MVQVLITNNAIQHDAEKWADATAKAITPFDPSLTAERQVLAQELRNEFARRLHPLHRLNQMRERDRLQKDSKYIHEPQVANDLADDAMTSLSNAVIGTPWEYHWRRDDVLETARLEIDSHFRSSQHLERLQFAEEHPENEDAQHYKTSFARAT